MAYRIAGIDVHKKMLAVVVADVEVEGEYEFERRRFGSNPEELRRLSAWLSEQQVEEVVMKSTAQYWQPVWGALERYWKPTRDAALPSARTGKHLEAATDPRGRVQSKPDPAPTANCWARARRGSGKQRVKTSLPKRFFTLHVSDESEAVLQMPNLRFRCQVLREIA
ncbi:MAG: transposase [Candidatus Sulfotelmatobacter sp.]|jgi:hypothetical protein